jgi:hypothetical protein
MMNLMRAKALSSLLLVAALGGCDPTTSQPAPSGWKVQLVGRGDFARVRGTAGVASQFGSTQAHIEVFGPVNAVFTWRIVRGSCAAPGSGFGAVSQYPELRLSDQDRGSDLGHATAQAQLSQMLEPGGSYALLVRTASEEIAACGDLQSQHFSPSTSPA